MFRPLEDLPVRIRTGDDDAKVLPPLSTVHHIRRLEEGAVERASNSSVSARVRATRRRGEGGATLVVHVEAPTALGVGADLTASGGIV